MADIRISHDPAFRHNFASLPTTQHGKRRMLMPAAPRVHKRAVYNPRRKSFYDLPPELRVEIYKLVLTNVTIHILPTKASTGKCPHALVRTSRQVRNEVLPMLHAQCPITATVTDFNFDGLLEWMGRMPADQEANLCKNQRLSVELVTTICDRREHSSNSMRNSQSLRRWLHIRADRYRPQPVWKYKGPQPDSKTAYDMKRRAKRAAKAEERRELYAMLKALGLADPPCTNRLTASDSSTSSD